MKEQKGNRKGISLIVIVITILVIVVLAGAIILAVSNNNPLSKANEAVYKSDLKNFATYLNLYVLEKIKKNGNITQIDAEGVKLETYIPSIKGNKIYQEILKIIDGKLYILTDKIAEKDQERLVKWANEVGIEAIGSPLKPIINKMLLEAGKDRIKVRLEVTDSKSGIVKNIYEISEDSSFSVVKEKAEIGEKEYIFEGLNKNTKYYVKAKAIDKNGNESEVKVGEIKTGGLIIGEGDIVFDLEPKLGEGVYTNKDVKITISYPLIDGAKGQYSLDGLTWSDYTGSITLTSNKTVYTKMIDESGDETDKHPSIQINKIDKLVPEEFAPVVREVNTNSLKISGIAKDAIATVEYGSSGIRGYQYKINGGSWITETTNPEYTFSGLDNKVSHTLSMRAIDRAGNVGIENSISGQIETISDEIIFVLNPNLGEGKYTNKNVTADITYPEIVGTSKKVSYDGNIWSDYTNTLIIEENKTIYAKLIDGVGNESKSKTIVIDKIDKIPPVVTTITLNNYRPGIWSNASLIIRVYSSDNISNASKTYQYSEDQINWSGFVNPWLSPFKEDVDKTLYFRVVDAAGNISSPTEGYNFKMEHTDPTITGVKASNITRESMDITISASDAMSGIRSYKLSRNNGLSYTNSQNSNAFNLSGLTANTEYSIKVQVIDNAGNEATSETYTFTTLMPPYDKPYIPTGFEHIEGTWNDGYVIKDTVNGNEFVWVPVKGMNEFKLTVFKKGQIGTETIPAEIQNSVQTYGGFYIGRYEQGNANDIKRGRVVYNINWINSASAAKAMYNNNEIATELIYGTMWDTTCNWLVSSGNKTQEELLDSRSWGNYRNNIDVGHGKLQKTGFNGNWKANNIYDFARKC